MAGKTVARVRRLLVGAGNTSTRDAQLLAAGTLTSRLSGLVRLIVLAVVLGVRPLSDAYNLANNTPNMLYDLLLGGVLSATIVPVLASRYREGDERAARRSSGAVLAFGLLGLALGTVVFEFLVPAIIDLYTIANHNGYAVDQRQLAIELLRLFAPQLFFYGAISLFTAQLNVRGNFAAAAFAPVVNNIVAVASLLFFEFSVSHPDLVTVMTSSREVLILGLGSTLGVAAQMLVLLPVVARLRVDVRVSFDWHDQAVREIIRLSGWTFGFVAANQVALFIVLALADARAGYVSAYNYAYMFFQLPYAILSASAINAVQPRLSALYSHRDLAGFRRLLGTALKSGTALTIPFAVAFLVAAPVGLRIALGYGRVGPAGVALTAAALRGFALGLPGFALFIALVRSIQASRNARVLFFLYLVENGLNVLLAFPFISHLGVFGLALASSVAYSTSAVLALLVARRLGLVGGLGSLAKSWARLALASVLAGAILLILLPSPFATFGILYLGRVVGASLVGLGVFVGVLHLTARLGGHEKGRSLWRLR